jgi:integrase
MILKSLTQHQINQGALRCPPGKLKVEMCVSSGLYSLSTPTNQTWYYRGKVQGRTKHFRIGNVLEVSLSDAKKQAMLVRAQLVNGVNMKADTTRVEDAGITLHDFFYDHFKPLQQPRLRSWDRYEELFRLRIDEAFGPKRLTQLTRFDFSAFMSKLLASGLSAASVNHHGKLARRICNVALDLGMLDKNPLARLSLYREENQKDTTLDQGQLGRLWATLKADEGQLAKLGRLLVATGVRSGEARLARWQDIRRDEKLWVIPASSSKSKRIRSIYLNSAALEVLDELDTKDKYEYLFVQRRSRSGAGLPLSPSLGKGWGKLCAKAGISDFTPHSARHLAASLMVQNGCTLYQVQHALGHASPTVSQRYAHLSIASQVAGVNTISTAIERAMQNSEMVVVPAVEA